MGTKEKRDARIRNNVRNVTFSDVIAWLSDCDFILDHTRGSHHIFRHIRTGKKLSFQPDSNGMAKAYQIRQAIQAIDSERDKA